ncbi:30S ribosomal protein S5 [uncultured archaeon]|nr:30S ribosomal protein S5 [uncultured archaeon]
MQRRRFESRPREDAPRAEWNPKTILGRKVKNGEITSLEQIRAMGRKSLEPQIIDYLLPDLREEVLDLSSMQRMTASGRKQQMRAVLVMGNGNGYVAVGTGKAPEARDAIAKAIVNAKKHVIHVSLGSGSWETQAKGTNSIPQTVMGRSGSLQLVLKPAPPGVGIVAGQVTRTVLRLAGVKDVWSFSKGRTRNVLNTVLATMDALDKRNNIKTGKRAKGFMQQAVEAGAIDPVLAGKSAAFIDTPAKVHAKMQGGDVNVQNADDAQTE